MQIDFIQHIINKNESIIRQYMVDENFSSLQIYNMVSKMVFGLVYGGECIYVENEHGFSIQEAQEFLPIKLGYYEVLRNPDSGNVPYHILHVTKKGDSEYENFFKKMSG